MSASFGVNLRVTGHSSRGGRKYMEDFFSVAYQEWENKKDLEYAFVGIYDGHGGAEAAKFARQHLIKMIVRQKLFWSKDDHDILQAIREGYIATHYAMWKDQANWPKTGSGLPSTAGTTASVAFIRNGKIYIGHCGDSGIVLGYADEGDETNWRAMPLTREHKPECEIEKQRITNSGGKVVVKSGVPRVVWNRPKIGHHGPIRRNTPMDEIPFLAVARSLGDFWSYNATLNKFVVSPDPDVRVIKINPKQFRCLIFGTDGLWNVISANSSVEIVRYAEQMNERNNHKQGQDRDWTNPSKCLVDKALEQWSTTRMRADNTSVVIVVIDPPGPPKRDVVRSNPQQQFIVEKSDFLYGVEEEGLQIPTVITNPDLNNYSLFDHRTNELTDLEKIAEPDTNNCPGGSDTWSDRECEDESGFQALNYQSTYEAAYNPMIHPIADDPLAPLSSYADEPVRPEPPPKEEPYSLICLETGQTTTTGYYTPYAHLSSVSRNYETYNPVPTNQNANHDKDQFNSISSSFLSQSCGIIQNNHDASEHNQLINNMFSPDMPTVQPSTSQHSSTTPVSRLEESTIDDHDEYLEKTPPTLPDDSFNPCDITISDSIDPDESIQIDEISSSSKENEANHSPVQYHIPLLRSTIKSMMRTTRSSKLPRTPSFDSRTKKPKTIAKKVVATPKSTPKCSSTAASFPSPRVSARRTISLSTPLQKTERRPVVASTSLHTSSEAPSKRTSLRTTLDLCKRTLRSKNSIGFKATKTTSTVSTIAGAHKSLLTPKQTKSAATLTPSSLSSSSRSSRLRDKVRSSYALLPSRPKLIVTSLSASARKIMPTDRSPANSKSFSTTTPKATHSSRFRKRLSR